MIRLVAVPLAVMLAASVDGPGARAWGDEEAESTTTLTMEACTRLAISLFLGAKTLNIFSLMAMVMLVGIVVNNAILILDYAQQLRRRGMAIKEALMEAAPIRLRPIVMANLAIALSMVPQALGGAGSEFRMAMAVVTMGGVLLSAVFTLFVIPVVYVFMDRFAR